MPIPTSDIMSISNTELNKLEPEIFGKQFKLVIIGNSHVGKTSLMLRYAENVFKDKHISTIGVDFKIVKVKVGDIYVKLQIWDTAGQDRFRTMSSTYYRGADGAIIVYDVTSLESFNNVGRWLEDMNMYNRNVYKIIVGNKNDNTSNQTLSTDTKVVSTQDAQKLAERLDLKLFETSAKEDLKTQASLFEGDIAKLNAQIIGFRLEANQKSTEIEKLQGEIAERKSKIENMATQREIPAYLRT